MKRIIALLLCLAMCVCLFAACNKEEGGSEENEGAAVKQYDFPANIPDEDYGGKEFRIATWADNNGDTHWGAWEFYYDETLTGDVVNDAVFERDKVFEEKYNVEIVYDVHSKGSITDEARTSIMAGSDDFDVLSTDISGAATLAREGLFLDLNSYSDILNLDESYWDPNASSQLSIEDHLFFTTSDLTLVDKQATWVLFFTKGLLEKYPTLTEGYENGIYDMVKEGDWTIERMYNMVKTVSSDANGDNQYTDVDIYGHCGEMFSLPSLMVGCGSLLTEKDANDIPEYIWMDNVDQHQESYQYVYDIVTNGQYSMLSSKMGGYGYTDLWIDGFGGMMTDERVLFNCTGMNRCKLYRDIECDFGIIPMPKANEQQEGYYSMMSMIQANTIAIPVTCQEPETVATLLEAFTCLASQTTYTAYIDKALAYKYLRDDDSQEMLEIIFDGRLYDPVDVYGWGTGNRTMFDSAPKPANLTSTVKAFANITEKQLKRGVENFREIYERQQND